MTNNIRLNAIGDLIDGSGVEAEHFLLTSINLELLEGLTPLVRTLVIWARSTMNVKIAS